MGRCMSGWTDEFRVSCFNFQSIQSTPSSVRHLPWLDGWMGGCMSRWTDEYGVPCFSSLFSQHHFLSVSPSTDVWMYGLRMDGWVREWMD